MKTRYFFIAVIFLLITSLLPLSAEQKEESIIIGKIQKFQSKILGEERRIFISLPDGYADSQERYPVLYCLTLADGIDIHYASGVARKMAQPATIPKMIVVGLCDVDGRRDLTPSYSEGYGPSSGGGDKFLQHLEKEIIPYVESQYRTRDLRIFWGHSIVGALGIYAFLKTPDRFHAYVLSSLYFIYDGDQQYLLNSTESYLKKRTGEKNFLRLTVGNEPRLKLAIEPLLEKLEKYKSSGIEWMFSVMQEENHRSVMALVLPEGLRSIFTDWRGRPSS